MQDQNTGYNKRVTAPSRDTALDILSSLTRPPRQRRRLALRRGQADAGSPVDHSPGGLLARPTLRTSSSSLLFLVYAALDVVAAGTWVFPVRSLLSKQRLLVFVLT